jgi:hypothetical protein
VEKVVSCNAPPPPESLMDAFSGCKSWLFPWLAHKICLPLWSYTKWSFWMLLTFPLFTGILCNWDHLFFHSLSFLS